MQTRDIFLFTIVSLSLLLYSCQKDEDPELSGGDVIVGIWNVAGAEATAYVDGLRIEGIEVQTMGTLEFEEDGSGYADFSLTFLDDTDTAKGPFEWRREGFEIVLHQEEELRYVVIKDESDIQHLQITYDEELTDDKIEFTFILERR